MTEAVAQTSVPAPGPPTGVTVTPGDRQYTLKWTHPSGISINDIDAYFIEFYDSALNPTGNSLLWADDEPTVVAANPYHTQTLSINGRELIFRLRVKRKSSVDPNNRDGAFSSYLRVTPRIPAPTGFTATLNAPTTGDRQVRLTWTAPSPLAVVSGNTQALTDYEYSRNGGTWTSIGLVTSRTESVENGKSYTFKVRGVRTGDPQNADPKGTESRTVTVRPLIDAPGTPGGLNVERVKDTAILTWSPPSDTEEDVIVRYEYSSDGGSTWESTGSSSTRYTVTGLEARETYTFLIRGVYLDGGTSRIISLHGTSSNSVVLNYPRRRIRQDCPVGWIRSDGFAGRNRRVLIYEVKVEMDIHNRVSIYKPVWVAIYVHPDEALENLDGWKLQVALPYNRHSEYLLTAENSVIVDADFVEGGFAFIENPEATPFPMTGMGFPGSPAPGFDYRLYDDSGRRVDFGISCYKRFDIFQVLKATEDRRVLRKVLLESFDWDSHYLRSEWTVVPPVPAAPSLIKGTIVGTWADLKKQ